MQKIEKWRIQELAQVLNHVAAILSQGKNREWAQVFSHFEQESHGILMSPTFDSGQLQNLLRNIKICFSENYTFKNIVPFSENPEGLHGLCQEFLSAQARLLKILEDLEKRSVELIH
jgi:hypothetical protein